MPATAPRFQAAVGATALCRRSLAMARPPEPAPPPPLLCVQAADCELNVDKLAAICLHPGRLQLGGYLNAAAGAAGAAACVVGSSDASQAAAAGLNNK